MTHSNEHWFDHEKLEVYQHSIAFVAWLSHSPALTHYLALNRSAHLQLHSAKQLPTSKKRLLRFGRTLGFVLRI